MPESTTSTLVLFSNILSAANPVKAEPSPLKLDAVTIPVNVACPVATWFASIVTPVPTTILSVVTSTFAVLNVVAVTTPAFPNFILLPTSTKSSTSNDWAVPIPVITIPGVVSKFPSNS